MLHLNKFRAGKSVTIRYLEEEQTELVALDNCKNRGNESMTMQHYFASRKPVEWMSILVSVSVILLFCWWIFFGFKSRSTSILAGTINLTHQRWSVKLHSTQI